ncbi:SHOCT domain-containing protein [Intrasporangium sp. YIM S08009]|uniref:SHOCT domain-containing protein n=1 Tax=Intrasporangium zincisolvens TaxID=3080018 RepID=UPI002B05917D|nr:SHOCT domain-containing protein [Intrasporangium sp. YIM S08009]
MSFWDIIWFIIVFFAFATYLMVLFSIVMDLFRDPEVSGWMKALWVACLILFTFITAIVYLIVRGRAMTERATRDAHAVRSAQDDYIRTVASGGPSPTDQIARAKELLDAGTITAEEFEALKTKALA